MNRFAASLALAACGMALAHDLAAQTEGAVSGAVRESGTKRPLLEPLATSSEQKSSAADLRDLPVSSLEEAIALSAGTVGQSYRGGRIGEESFILDGLGIKNQLDAASGGLGLRIPPDMLGEASLVTNG